MNIKKYEGGCCREGGSVRNKGVSTVGRAADGKCSINHSRNMRGYQINGNCISNQNIHFTI